MNDKNKKEYEDMINYIEHLIKSGIYCYGSNIHMIATHLVSSGCRIHLGNKRKKQLNNLNKVT